MSYRSPQPRPPRVLSSSTSGCESKNGAASAIGTQPMIVIQPTSALCGCGGFHLRTSTVPNAHVTAAAKSIATPNGALLIARSSSPMRIAIPAMPSTSPVNLRLPSGSCNTTVAIAVAHKGIV